MLYALGGYLIRFKRIVFRILTLQLTEIISSRASIHATYGTKTRIGSGSVITLTSAPEARQTITQLDQIARLAPG